jgi:hypothetical protein
LLAVHPSFSIAGSSNSSSYLLLSTPFPGAIATFCCGQDQFYTILAAFLTLPHYQSFFFLVVPFFILKV